MAFKAKDDAIGKWKYVCRTPNFWGSGKTENQAIRACKRAGGKRTMEEYGYRIDFCNPNVTIDPVDGALIWPLEQPPVEVFVSGKMRKASRKPGC